METQTETAAQSNSETLASAMDVINLHPDANDAMKVDEVDDAAENMLLNPEETQQSCAPRPLFMGPKRKNRRARGTRGARNGAKNDVTNNRNDDTPYITSNSGNSAANPRKAGINLTVKAMNNGTNAHHSTTRTDQLAAKTPKRVRSEQSSPNTSDTAKPNAPKKQKTYAEVVRNDLKLQITNHPNGIGKTQLETIENYMMGELDKFVAQIPTPTAIPRYHTSSFNHGILKLICTDVTSANWIKTTVANMPALWEGANLAIEVCNPPNANPMAVRTADSSAHPRRIATPRRPTIRFFIPSGLKKPEFEEIAKRIQVQNQPLETSNWIAWKAEEKDGGFFYHVSVDDSAIDIIKAMNARLFYCFSKIKINLPKPKGNVGSQTTNVLESVNNEGAE